MKKPLDYINFITQKIIAEHDLNKSVIDARDLGLFLRNNVTSCYSLKTVEETLIKKVIASTQIVIEIERRPANAIAFIVSEPFDRGGHTRLMENLASFLDEKPFLFVTRNCDEQIFKRLKNFFNNIEKQYDRSFRNEIDKIISFARDYASFQKLILNIHPDDIHGVLAVGLAKHFNPDLTVYFVNHADHSFTYGTTVSDFWFEISFPGKIIDGMRALKAKKSFLGIPVKFTYNKNEFHTITNGDVFLTGGSATKFMPRRGFSLLPLINELLKKYPKSVIYVIGCRPSIDFWWWSLKLKYTKRLILKKSLPYEQYLLLAAEAKVYIDSHPYPGGTAFVEQYISGKRCIGLISPVQGYSPAELLKKNSVDEVLSTINVETDISNLIKEVHGIDSVQKRFNDTIYHSVCSENMCESIIPWTGDAFFLENDKVVKIPRAYKLFTVKTFHLFRFCSLRVILLFLLEKLYLSLRKMSVK